MGCKRPHFSLAQAAAKSMLKQHGVDAVFVAQREVDTKITHGDIHGALIVDQVRRELLNLIVDMDPPAHY